MIFMADASLLVLEVVQVYLRSCQLASNSPWLQIMLAGDAACDKKNPPGQ
jgi:hypothetical protein